MTTEPNTFMKLIHDRMPVILDERGHDRWLDLRADPDDILTSCYDDWLEVYPVDKRVGNVLNNDAGLA